MSSIKFTPTPTDVSPTEKENDVPSSSTSSIFQNFLSRLSPKKLSLSLLTSPFTKSPKRDSVGISKSKRPGSGSSSSKNSSSSELTGIGQGLDEFRELCALLRRESAFIRKVGQILRKNANKCPEGANSADFDDRQQFFYLTPTQKQRQQRSRGATNRGVTELGPLERTVVRLKHAQSAKFQQEHMGRTFCGDSLTFEFFNTIAPFLAGPAYAHFDVFLCAMNTKRGKVDHWDHLLSFISPVNRKQKGSRVLEVWIPDMAAHDGCDQLFLVVQGRIVVGVGEEQQQKAGSIVAKSEQNPSCKNALKIGAGVKRKHPHESEEKGAPIEKKKLKISATFSYSGPTKSPRVREQIFLKPSTGVEKMEFQGIKQIGQWQKVEGSGRENGIFQPLFTHNGMLLNISSHNDNQLVAEKKPDGTMIEELLEKNKAYGRGTCHMLQMEVSNEHGYGTLINEKCSSTKNTKNIVHSDANSTKRIQKKYYFIDETVDTAIANVFHVPKWLKSMGGSVPSRCVFCKKHLPSVWSWAVHLIGVHPSLSFKFMQFEQENGEGITVELRKMPDEFGRHQDRVLTKKTIQLLRANILAGLGRKNNNLLENNVVAKTPSKKSNDEDDGPKWKKVQSAGKMFKGILPVNPPNYTELKYPPFANLHGVDSDQAWVRDAYSIRLNQFTDVSDTEKAFFLLWNSFITRRQNRQLGYGKLPFLLHRFVDEFGQKLHELGLMANLIFHCSTLEAFGYINRHQMTEVLDYAVDVAENGKKK